MTAILYLVTAAVRLITATFSAVQQFNHSNSLCSITAKTAIICVKTAITAILYLVTAAVRLITATINSSAVQSQVFKY